MNLNRFKFEHETFGFKLEATGLNSTNEQTTLEHERKFGISIPGESGP